MEVDKTSNKSKIIHSAPGIPTKRTRHQSHPHSICIHSFPLCFGMWIKSQKESISILNFHCIIVYSQPWPRIQRVQTKTHY